MPRIYPCHACTLPEGFRAAKGLLWVGIWAAALPLLVNPMLGATSFRRPFGIGAMVENCQEGQPEVRFGWSGQGYAVWFGPDKVWIGVGGNRVVVEFAGAAPASVRGVESSGLVSFISAQLPAMVCPGWRAIVYEQLYPGVDLVYRLEGEGLKSEFHLQPGADPSQIRLRYRGARRLELGDDGALLVEAPWGQWRERAPVIYQPAGASGRVVNGGYRLEGDTVSFWLGTYDPAQPLIIDPQIEFSTYYGGASIDKIEDMAVDAMGNIYVTGWTDSANLPLASPLQTRAGSVDAFVAKFRAQDGSLEFATYIGGRGDDRAFGIALDGAGSIILTGWTSSTDFPTVNAVQGSLAGGRDAFVLRLRADGQQLLFSTYLGGSGQDSGNAVAVDSNGNIYVGGETTSWNFPRQGGVQNTLLGPGDGFLARFSPSGQLQYSSLFGGRGLDRILAVAADTQGAAYVAGVTDSTDLPVVAAFQSAIGGGQDAFVAKFAPAGNALIYCSYLGGAGGSAALPEMATDVALDDSGRLYVVGTTSSGNFPVVNAYQPSHAGGGLDAFVARVSADGRTLEYSSYFGGHGPDYGEAVAIDNNGAVYLAGYTASVDLPVLQAAQTTMKGLYDGFVARLDGATLGFSTYLGGSAVDGIAGLARTSDGRLVVAGSTQSWDFPVVGASQQQLAGSVDGFITRLTLDAPAAPEAVSVTPSSGAGATQTFAFLFRDANGWQEMRWTYMMISSALTASGSCYLQYNYRDNIVWLRDDSGTSWLGPATLGTATVLQNSQCSVDAAASSASGSGTDLTVRLAITFKPSYWGLKNVYMYVADVTGRNSGWQLRGTWSAGGNQAPEAVSVTPSSGSGTSQTFAFLFRDANGWQEMRWSYVMIAPSLTQANSCYVQYNQAENAIRLRNDAGTGWLGPVAPGVAATLENSQCIVNAGSSSVTGSGTDMTVRLAITFKPAYSGSKNVYMYVADVAGTNSGWQLRGTWSVP